MKKNLLIYAVLATAAVVACVPEEKVDDAPKKSSECKLSSLVVNVGEGSIEAFIDQSEKTLEISYMPNEYLFLSAATATAVISDNASITPDPAEVLDYTQESLVFTVTAEDGESVAEYRVVLAEAEFTQKAVYNWSKTYGELGINAYNNTQSCVAFCDVDKFAYNSLDVFDLEGNKLGTLNTEGVPGLDTYNGQLGSMSNDENGVLVALCCYGGPHESSTVKTSIYAWIDGWDNAPTLIYGPVDYECYYMSVAGDVTGKFVLNLRNGVTAPPQMHHVLVYDGNGYKAGENITWHGVKINHPCNDGCWGQQLSFFSGDPEDGFVCWDSLEAAELGETGNRTSAFYVYDGLTAYENQFNAGEVNETILKGGVNWVDWDSDGRFYGYGNFSTGHARAFIYNGQKYVLACSSSWPCNWITIQKADNIVEDDDTTDDKDESKDNYFLPTWQIADAASCYPSGAYVYDPATGTGHVLVGSQASCVVAFDMITDRI